MIMKNDLQTQPKHDTLKLNPPPMSTMAAIPKKGISPPSSGAPRSIPYPSLNGGAANTTKNNQSVNTGANMARAAIGGVGSYLRQNATGIPVGMTNLSQSFALNNMTQNVGGQSLNVGSARTILPENIAGVPATPIQAPSSNVPPQLLKGVVDEGLELDAIGQTKNSKLLRPSIEDINSELFKEIVGDPKYTKVKKWPVGTIFDAVDPNIGYTEIKTGKSVLNSSYQQKLQLYFAKKAGVPYNVRTNRPIEDTFKAFLEQHGTNIQPLSSTGAPSVGGAGNTAGAASTSTAKNTANALDTAADGVKASTAKNTANALDAAADGVKASTAKNTANALDAAADGVKASTVANATADVAGDALKSGAHSGLGTAAKYGGKALGVLGVAMDAKELYDSYQSDGGKIGENTVTSAGGMAGSWGGAALGAKAGAIGGAALGSVIPVVGTALGGAIGGILGGIIGGIGGNWFGKKVANSAYNEFNGGE